MTALTRELIIDEAIRVADRDGFEAVTLRRIARGLDAHVTSLYNHVPTRDAITDGIVQALIDEAKLPSGPVGWEEWVRSFFAAMGTVASNHPGAFAALTRRPVQGPRAAASFEVALDAFTRAGLSDEQAYEAVKTAAFTALTVALERSIISTGATPSTAAGPLPPESFPHMRRLALEPDPDRAWAFALETLVAGLRSQLRRHRRHKSQ
jgi:AcrR family transcriptional regulator